MTVMLWIIAAIMTAAVLAILLRPLLGAASAVAPREAYDLEVYREQLRELAADTERGLITAEQQEGARVEIERRMLAVSDAASHARSAGAIAKGWRYVGAVVVVAMVPLGGIWLYQVIGSPHLPDQPLTARMASAPGPVASGGDVELDAAVVRLTERLKTNPQDLDGWVLLGRSHIFLGRYSDAVSAYGEAAALAPDNPDIAASLGEAIVMAAGGIVTPSALRVFNTVVELDPTEPSARYYQALAALQAGRAEEAMLAWKALADESPADAPWLSEVQARIEEAAAAAGVEAPAIARAEPSRGPTAEQMAAAADMEPEDRDAMIRSMVERLAERLAEDPDDFTGWMRLANAYWVLGETPRARDAYSRAVELKPEDLDALTGKAQAMMEMAEPDAPLPAPAVEAFRKILSVDGNRPDALWYVAIAEEQAGRRDAAVTLLQQLLSQLRPGSEEHNTVTERLAALGAETSSLLPPTERDAPPPLPGGDVNALKLSADERREMVRGMVARLETRLEREPDDHLGWTRLADAYQELGEPALAEAAHVRAVALRPDASEALAGYAQAAGFSD